MTQTSDILKCLEMLQNSNNFTCRQILESLETIGMALNLQKGNLVESQENQNHVDFKESFQGLLQLLLGVLTTFNDLNEDIIYEISAILDKLELTNLPMDLMVKGLESPHHALQILSLKYVKLNMDHINFEPHLIKLMVHLLTSENLQVVEKTRNVILQLVVEKPDANIVQMASGYLIDLYDSHKYATRAYNLVIELACSSPLVFDQCRSCSLLRFALGFDFSGDILQDVALVELFLEISEKESGALFLSTSGVLPKLAQSLSVTTIDSSIVLNSIIKFWGFFAFQQPDHFQQIDSSLSILLLLAKLFQEDTHSRDSVIIAIGNIGSTPKGLLYMAQSNLLALFLDIVPRASGDLKLSCLRTISCLLSHSKHPECHFISQRIYQSLSFSNQSDKLKYYAESAVMDISIAALSILKEIVAYDWGLNQLADNSALCNFLLDRLPNDENVIKEWKYSIVQHVALDAQASGIFAPSVFQKMVEFAKAGPFQAEYTPSVAFASA